MSLKEIFPWLKYPIMSAPMAGVAGSELAIAVSSAGGLGFIAAGYDLTKLSDELLQVIEARKMTPELKVAVGIITHAVKDEEAFLNVLSKYKEHDVVAALWLFGGDESRWIKLARQKLPHLKIMVQVWTVQDAKIMADEGADIIVAQGSDAGGHGGASAASIISLLPEILEIIPASIPVIAAGGLSNGKSILAATCLGASGVVLGTRFMLTKESKLPIKAKTLATKTTDGGRTTTQTGVYDQMRGTTDWPAVYSGRAIANKTLEEHLSGRDIKELKGDYTQAVQDGDYSRVVCWAGTGVGLMNEILPAAEVVATLVKEYDDAASKVRHSIAL